MLAIIREAVDIVCPLIRGDRLLNPIQVTIKSPKTYRKSERIFRVLLDPRLLREVGDLSKRVYSYPRTYMIIKARAGGLRLCRLRLEFETNLTETSS